VVTQGSGGPAGGCVTETASVVYLWQGLGFWRPLRSREQRSSGHVVLSNLSARLREEPIWKYVFLYF
jgi:hypothetical protein